jgi:dCMP deaminase
LFQKYAGAPVYLLSRDIISEFRPLTKDLRALTAEVIKSALETWNNVGPVTIADAKTLESLSGVTIVMPDEDISHSLASKYFSNHEIEFSPVFLRWDRRRSEATEAPGVGHTISKAEADKKFMNLANLESQSSSDIWRRVGALIVKDGEVLLHGYNQAQPTDITPWVEGDPRNNFGKGEAIEMSLFIHAEANLIAQAAKAGIALEGTDIYVTTFPCPNCAKLIVNAGIKKCYFATGYAMLDGNRIFEANGVEVVKVDVALSDGPEEIWAPYPDTN